MQEEKADRIFMKNRQMQNLVGDLNTPLSNGQKEKIKKLAGI